MTVPMPIRGGAVPAVGLAAVAEVHDEVLGLAASFDPAAVTAAEAALVVRHVGRMRNALATVEALAAQRVADSAVWRVGGAKSPAVWLAGQAGTTAGQAGEALATAARLEALPATAEAARAGVLSPQQLAAVSDAAAAAPSKEAELLESARITPLGVLREQCLAVKAAADADPMATYTRQRAARSLVRGKDGEGMWTLRMRTTADDGARIDAALDPILDRLFQAARRDGRREPRQAYAADALVQLACAEPDQSDPAAADTRRSAERFLALIRVDAAALQRGSVADGECCEIPGIGPIPVQIARDVLGEAVCKLVITKGIDVANVTHLGRGPSAAQKIALAWTQPLCTREGCGHRRGLENDHRIDWAETHHTRIDETDPLCGADHDLKTYHGWALVEGHGVRPMVPPDDPRHPRHRGKTRDGPSP